MSGLNSPFYRALTVANGSVRKTGVSKNLGKGELALVDVKDTTKVGGNIGARVLTSLAGKVKDDKRFQIRLGSAAREFTRSNSSSAYATPTFSLNEVKSVRVSVPERTEQQVDELILGYNGIDPETAFKFNRGTGHFNLWVELTGGAIPFNGSGCVKEIFEVSVHVPECDITDTCVECDGCEDVDCQGVTNEIIRRLQDKELTGGTRFEDYAEITPIFSCDADADRELIEYIFYEITVCDRGTENDLTKVQAQYPGYKVVAKDRVGPNSVYELLLPASEGAPADYTTTIDSILKDCEDCPAGYAATDAGYIYAITIEDDGADLTRAIDDLPGFVTGSVIKSGNDNGVGFYTVLVEDKLTQAQIEAFLTESAVKATARFKELGEARQICENNTVEETSWTEKGSCNVSTDRYTITLADNKCGEDRLEELQIAYPDLDIVIADSTDSVLTGTINLGTTGQTSNINVNGVDYVITDNPPNTAADFVAAEAAAILADSGITVTARGDNTLVFTGDTGLINAITITGDVTWVTNIIAMPNRRACQTKYEATVITNMVCEECDPVFEAMFTSDAPEKYDGNNKWTKLVEPGAAPAGNCLCGIRIKAKPFVIDAEEALREDLAFVETSASIKAAAGYPSEQRLGVGRVPNTSDAFEAIYLTKKSDRDNLAGNMRNLEQESMVYFTGEQYPKGYLERLIKGQVTNLPDSRNQVRVYYIEFEHRVNTQSFANISTDNIVYSIIVEEGKHQDVEALANAVAVGAGLSVVRVTA